MPFYYSSVFINYSSTTAEGTIYRFLSAAAVPFNISAFLLTSASGTAGGKRVRLSSFGTASTGGTALTPSPRHASSPAASTTTASNATAITAGSGTRTDHLSIGVAQTGGTGGWFAMDPNAAIQRRAGGGANGNVDVLQIATTAEALTDMTVEFFEI